MAIVNPSLDSIMRQDTIVTNGQRCYLLMLMAASKEDGVFDCKAGKDFLNCILERGGSVDPMALFIEFRGRKPTVDALLRHSGPKLTEHSERQDSGNSSEDRRKYRI